MAQFDESKIISPLHTEKAEVGKKYWFSDYLSFLKVVFNESANKRYLCLERNYTSKGGIKYDWI